MLNFQDFESGVDGSRTRSKVPQTRINTGFLRTRFDYLDYLFLKMRKEKSEWCFFRFLRRILEKLCKNLII